MKKKEIKEILEPLGYHYISGKKSERGIYFRSFKNLRYGTTWNKAVNFLKKHKQWEEICNT